VAAAILLVCRAAYLIVIDGEARDQSDSKAVVATALPATPKHREGGCRRAAMESNNH